MALLTVAILYGGKSTEHEVSIHSAQTVCRLLQARPERYRVLPIFIDKQGYWFLQKECGPRQTQDVPITPVITAQANLKSLDGAWNAKADVFFPVLHGTNCEDGTMQGFLETLDAAYVGCGVLASAMGMDKLVAKQIARNAGVNVLAYQRVHRGETYDLSALKTWVTQQGLPVFVKPVRLGSSVGVRKVKEIEELQPAIDFALQFDSDVMIEKGVEAAREIFCALYGEGETLLSSACGELRTLAGEFFDYNAKYVVAGGCETNVPADIPAQTAARMRQDSETVFRALGGSGLARVDFLMDKEGHYYFSEINTLPGLSETSLYPQLFEASGQNYAQLLDGMIDLALDVWARKRKLSLNR
ncbi:MAG: D-alanine--D-alanine ligase [Elusimicrobiaceae bacterium]|nr:D-alanine--D-alanine ligase [Elusimicrobiaceae bacterium]